jgi:lysophospholipase L1-like esterase
MKHSAPLTVFLIFFVALSAPAQVTHQRLFDTVGFLPDHFAKRVAYFEAERMSRGRMVFLGNSITEAGQWKKLTGDSTVANRGIGGDITFGILKRLNEILIARPSRVFLLIGINDIGKDIPDAVIADNIRKIIERFQLESPEKLYVHSILPVNPTIRNFPQHYDKNEHVKKSNQLIREITAQRKVTFVDLHKIFSNPDGLLKAALTHDGLHLNAEGYRLWAEHLKSIGAF